MSTIVAPYPVPDIWDQDPLSAPRPQELCWWRFRLEENDEHNILILPCDATGEDTRDATWVSWDSSTVPIRPSVSTRSSASE